MVCSLPQLGKSRTVDRVLWFTAAGLCVCSLATAIADGRHARLRYLLTPVQILNEMQNRQLSTDGVQVRLAVPITTAIANPPLDIQSVALLNSHEMRLRMNCRDRSECLPFFVTATYLEELSPASIQTASVSQSLDKILPVSTTRANIEPPPASTQAKHAGHADSSMLRSGSSATLDFDEDRVHIRIEVICLESGAAGDKIRVTSRDRKQVYVAKIVTPTLVKGTF